MSTDHLTAQRIAPDEVFPLPLGEGQGEGLATKESPTNLLNNFASAPLPGPLPTGEGVFNNSLGFDWILKLDPGSRVFSHSDQSPTTQKL